jgi:hypothetical protein
MLEPQHVSKLRRLLVNRFVDLRYMTIWLAAVLAISSIVSHFSRFSWLGSFAIVAVVGILLGVSTLADE